MTESILIYLHFIHSVELHAVIVTRLGLERHRINALRRRIGEEVKTKCYRISLLIEMLQTFEKELRKGLCRYVIAV